MKKAYFTSQGLGWKIIFYRRFFLGKHTGTILGGTFWDSRLWD